MKNIINETLLDPSLKSIYYKGLSDKLSNKISQIKLIVSDLDGTFLSSNGELSHENISSVKSLYNKNINHIIRLL